ncbi:MAG: alpha/beta fold hydrolase [Flavobacteriia bacterium]|jgi:pimeloyl-ACP methyl ester carboxylesterase
MPNSLLWSRTEGTGRTVVFLHGFMESSNMWDHLSLNDLTYKKVFIDLPGHGNSPLLTGEGDPSIAEMAAHVIATLEDLNITDFDVVGHSMGGYVALELKKREIGCRRVILLNSNFWEDSVEKKRDRVRVADLALKAKDLLIHQAIPGLFFRKDHDIEHIQFLINEAKKMLPESIAYSALAMRNRMDCSSLLSTLPNDFLVLHGAHDPLVSMETMHQKMADLPVKWLAVPQAGHMAFIEQSETVKSEIINFLQS